MYRLLLTKTDLHSKRSSFSLSEIANILVNEEIKDWHYCNAVHPCDQILQENTLLRIERQARILTCNTVENY